LKEKQLITELSKSRFANLYQEQFMIYSGIIQLISSNNCMT